MKSFVLAISKVKYIIAQTYFSSLFPLRRGTFNAWTIIYFSIIHENTADSSRPLVDSV